MLDDESKKTLAKLVCFSQYSLAQITWRPIKHQFFFFQALLHLPAVDGSGLQCVSVILIWLDLALTDLWELLVDLLHNEFIHLFRCSAPFLLSGIFLLPENPLQRPLQVRQTVLVLEVVRRAHYGVHQGKVLHPHLHREGQRAHYNAELLM